MKPSTQKLHLSTKRPATSAVAAGATAMAGEKSRLSVFIPAIAHRDLKSKAALAGKDLQDYLVELLAAAGIAMPQGIESAPPPSESVDGKSRS
jgi:hypothetical protein